MRFHQEQQIVRNEEYTDTIQRNTNTGNLNIEQFTTNLFDEALLDRELSDLFNNFNNDNELQGEVERIKVFAWNASGLSNNLDRLIHKMKREGIMIAIVSESWYHPDRHIPDICIFNSLGAVSPNLNRGTNGVSIVVNPNFINSPHIKNMICLAKDTVNGCFLTIRLAGLKIVGIYNAPSHPLDLDSLLDEIAIASRILPGEAIIFAGDFNARRTDWNDTTTNTAGNRLHEWMNAWNIDRFDTGPEPTCTTARGNSIVDHVFSNLPELNARICRSPVPLTDHRPILFEFLPRTYIYDQPESSYMRIKKEKLRDKDIRIQFGLESMRTQNALIDCLNELEHTLTSQNSTNLKQQAIDRADKTFNEFFLGLGKRVLGETRAGKKKIEYEPLMSHELERLYELQEENPTIERMGLIANELCRLKRIRFEGFAEKLSRKPPTDVLKIVAQINCNRRTRQSALQDNQQALAEYASYFASMTTNSLPRPAAEPTGLVLNIDPDNLECISDTMFSTSKIFNILIDVPWNKTAGNSGVCYDLIKAADLSIISLLSRLFKIFFRTGLIPLSWTRSIVIPVPKKGNLNEIKNYRPISLTESIRKIFEHCLVRFLTVSISPMHFSQGGFRSDHCCSDMISSLHEVLNKNKNTHIAFLDIKAAYDSVDRKILWKRCRERGITDEIIRILQRLFDHNSSQIAVNGRRSQPFGINDGLLQGSVLSPFLYSVFIDDLAKELQNLEKLKVGNFSLNCTMYADDIAIFAASATGLQDLLNFCQQHAITNRYRFNVSKCAVVGEEDIDYVLDGMNVPKTDIFVYLGVEIGRNGIETKKFIERRCKNAVDAGMKMVAMGMNFGGFSPQVSSMLYKVFIRSKLEAGSCLIPQNKILTKKLEAAQRKILARILFCGPNSSGTIVRSLLNTPTMAFRQKYLRSRYVHRLQELPENHILRQSMNCPRNFLKKLGRNTFAKEECLGNGKCRLKHEEMAEVHATTCASTRGHLVIENNGKLPWFLHRTLDAILRKRICHWILKKFPAAAPGRCGRCHHNRCTQEHIAECTEILRNVCEEIPARFRPEHLLSIPESNLETIGRAINYSVSRCLPQLRLN